MIHSFLLIGQSNMAGRGFAKEVKPIFNEKIKMLRNGRWQIMMEPIHNDRPTAGIGLAASFAGAWCLKHPQDEIGLIPCADGGTNIDDWRPDGPLFDNAIAQAKLAQRTSQLSGILWHQGESDCLPDRVAAYPEKLGSTMNILRMQLNALDIPLIVGGLGDFLTAGLYGQYFNSYPLINKALLQYAQAQDHCYYVTATGLTANEDKMHFNAASQRALGVRYFNAFDTMKHVTEPLAHEQETIQSIYERPSTQNENKLLLEYRFASGEISLSDFQSQLASIMST